MKTMVKRFQASDEGLDLVQLLIAVVIMGFLLAVGTLILIGKANDAKLNSSDAAVANAVTAASVVLSEGVATTPAAIDAAVEAAISGSDVTVAVTPPEAGPPVVPGVITLTGTNGASATVNFNGVVNVTDAS